MSQACIDALWPVSAGDFDLRLVPDREIDGTCDETHLVRLAMKI
jgi:hypothetical protein